MVGSLKKAFPITIIAKLYRKSILFVHKLETKKVQTSMKYAIFIKNIFRIPVKKCKPLSKRGKRFVLCGDTLRRQATPVWKLVQKFVAGRCVFRSEQFSRAQQRFSGERRDAPQSVRSDVKQIVNAHAVQACAAFGNLLRGNPVLVVVLESPGGI